ncbi:MAG: hypothetical protein JW885_16080 [Deltaproteobacteria bacterium]|nr:hypothetical protein [Candidatus Zymogenaceae bacterium]
MAKIGDEKSSEFLRNLKMVSDIVKGSSTLEDASQKYTELLYKTFRESIIQTRIFVTVPFAQLPDKNKDFVTGLAKKTNITELIKDQTPVLSLLGTNGVEVSWNDRRKSQGHVGIPLASADFIEAIPMMSRLLKSLGADLDWIDSRDSDIVTKTLGSMSGVFYVEDAQTETDSKGRKIIAAQDFVRKYDVKTVFGIGGGISRTPYFVVNVNFLRDTILRFPSHMPSDSSRH